MTDTAKPAQRRPRRRLGLVLALTAVIGGSAFAIGSDHPGRAGGSFLAGLLLVVAAFEFGRFNITMADRYVPGLALAAAMFSYVMTAVGLGIVLAMSSPRVVDATAIASGLASGLVVWLGHLIRATWLRPENTPHPVNISLHDGSPTDT
ncbi:MAG: hypothetical protein ABJA87_10290 [bacterium]